MQPTSVYIHFPWCLQKCPYCDFVSYAKPREDIDHQGYADAVLRELATRAEAYSSRERPLRTVFFGGGTPSLWEAAELGRVIEGLRTTFGFEPGIEITAECNPSSLDVARASALKAAGVNRLSIGVQSTDAAELKFLGRLHDGAGALAALHAARDAGFERYSGDLIFGLAGQTVEGAAARVRDVLSAGPTHLSCYQLTIEPGTRFGELAKVGRLPIAVDEHVAQAFLDLDTLLTAEGFEHYEISNYARLGEQSRHNLAYWHGETYLGVGCGAVGCVPDPSAGATARVRYRNPPRPEHYMQTAHTLHAAPEELEHLDAECIMRERIMLGLRLATGFDIESAAVELGVAAWPAGRRRAAENLAERARLVLEGGTLRMSRDAWLFTDDTAARLF